MIAAVATGDAAASGVEHLLARLLLVLRLAAPTPGLAHRVELLADAARVEGLAPSLVVSVCIVESGLRVRNRRASLCGCGPHPVDDTDAAQARCAARSLAVGIARCGSVDGAVSRYVWGRCAPSRGTTPGRAWWRAHVRRYLRLRARVEARLLGG